MIRTEPLRSLAELEAVRAEWSGLHRAARPGTPFEHPAWALAWARSFVPDGALECVAVRDDRRGGQLIGFAPLYRRRWAGPGPGIASIQHFGTGHREALTEVVQVLTMPARAPEVLRAVVRHLEEVPGWNWLQLSLGPGQGWFVPQWLRGRGAYAIQHRTTRPCVVVSPLPPNPDELARRLKRNVRESVRRARNRSARWGDICLVTADCPHAVLEGLDTLTGLHRQRAEMRGKVGHDDVLRRDGLREFMAVAVRDLARDGLARVHLAKHADTAVAGMLVLSDGDTDYISLTGLDPRFWSLSLNTLLTFEALSYACRAGRTAVNLSTGPDVAKLRWSPQIRSWNDFAVVRGDPVSRLAYGAYFHVSFAVQQRQERRRHAVRE